MTKTEESERRLLRTAEELENDTEEKAAEEVKKSAEQTRKLYLRTQVENIDARQLLIQQLKEQMTKNITESQKPKGSREL
jgi:predicted phage gp36 major capsid-like protein